MGRFYIEWLTLLKTVDVSGSKLGGGRRGRSEGSVARRAWQAEESAKRLPIRLQLQLCQTLSSQVRRQGTGKHDGKLGVGKCRWNGR